MIAIAPQPGEFKRLASWCRPVTAIILTRIITVSLSGILLSKRSFRRAFDYRSPCFLSFFLLRVVLSLSLEIKKDMWEYFVYIRITSHRLFSSARNKNFCIYLLRDSRYTQVLFTFRCVTCTMPQERTTTISLKIVIEVYRNGKVYP